MSRNIGVASPWKALMSTVDKADAIAKVILRVAVEYMVEHEHSNDETDTNACRDVAACT